MFYDDFWWHSGIFVFFQIILVWALLVVGLAVWVGRNGKRIGKRRFEFIGFVNVWEL
jgi:hypothetical protein